MSDPILATSLAQMAGAAFGPSLRPGEEIVMVGGVMSPAPWWTLIFRSAVETASIRVAILTNQRLVLVQTKSWAGKWTPDTIRIMKSFELAEVTQAEARRSVLVLKTGRGDLKLVGYKAFGLLATPPGFLADMLAYINSHQDRTSGVETPGV